MLSLKTWVAGALLCVALTSHAKQPEPPIRATVQAAFTPWDDVEGLVVASIDRSQRQILMQAYLLTNKRISKALIAAHNRGVEVCVLADRAQLTEGVSSRIPDLIAAGIAVWLETKYQNAHNKILVIDAGTADGIVITGSFNFTWTAQYKNAENILIVRDSEMVVARYAGNWERHKQDAIPYQP